MRCIITGCALINEEGLWVAGDLFDAGDVYVFNGNYNEEERAPGWIGGQPFYAKQLRPGHYWERRSVFIIPKDKANLNPEALKYIGRQL